MLIAVVRGAMGPLLERTIKEKLTHEHKVLEGEAERVQVRHICVRSEEW